MLQETRLFWFTAPAFEAKVILAKVAAHVEFFPF